VLARAERLLRIDHQLGLARRRAEARPHPQARDAARRQAPAPLRFPVGVGHGLGARHDDVSHRVGQRAQLGLDRGADREVGGELDAALLDAQRAQR
jgi:hypothetical protein